MSDYDNLILSGDLDAFRSDGNIITRSFTISGSLTAGQTRTFSASTLSVANLDFYQIHYTNSYLSSSKWRDLNLEWLTPVLETTTPTELSAILLVGVANGVMSLSAEVFNPWAYTISLQSTTISFRIVAYDSTLN